MIVVVDSGVWISALHFKGVPLLALERIVSRHQVVLCEQIIREIRTALMEKFGWSDNEVKEVIAFYGAKAMRVNATGILRGVCRDPNDDMVFECAVIAGSDLIIAGDKDLLAIEVYRGIRVLTPRQFLEEFREPRITT